MSDPDTSLVYVADDLLDRIWWRQDWGQLGLNATASAQGENGGPLQIRDVPYQRGLGQHANGVIVIALEGKFSLFEAEVGVQWQRVHAGTVVFQIFVDGEKRFESEVMRDRDRAKPVKVDLIGAQELQLVAKDGGDGIHCDLANWADARLRRNPNPPSPGLSPLNMAQFARVVSFDVNRTEGTQASRTEPFPQEDLRLSADVTYSQEEGGYVLEGSQDGVGCIGLEWVEPRFLRRLSLQFQNGDVLPPPETVHLQSWTGESPWQGRWIALDHQRRQTRRQWSWEIPCNAQAIQKLRWIFPPVSQPLVIRSFLAHTWSSWRVAELALEVADHGILNLEIYNGVFLGQEGEGQGTSCSWNPAQGGILKVQYSQSARCRTDKTMIRFEMEDCAFSVAVEDVLEQDGVYVEAAQVLLVPSESGLTMEGYKKRVSAHETVLSGVRKLQDQTFSRAMEKVHDGMQDNGPIMLSLSCDNRKFVVHRDGRVEFGLYDAADASPPSKEPLYPLPFVLVPELGAAQAEAFSRGLTEEWLPAPEHICECRGARYIQRTMVIPWEEQGDEERSKAWVKDKALCVSQFEIENPLKEEVEVSLALSVEGKWQGREAERWEGTGAYHVSLIGDRILAFLDGRGLGSLNVGLVGNRIRMGGTLRPGRKVSCEVLLPAWHLEEEESFALLAERDSLDALRTYWQNCLADAMEVELPDPLLQAVIRTSPVHCLMASRNEEAGERVAPCIAADRYYTLNSDGDSDGGPFESEAQAVIRGMDLMGHSEYARRSFSFFQKRFKPEGYLTTGYTLIGTGEFLWTLAEHYERTKDREWLEGIIDTVRSACRWILQERRKTIALQESGSKNLVERGLLPPGVAADWNRYAYRFFQEAQYYAGLSQGARLLAELEYSEAQDMEREAKALKQDILRAYKWTQARSPVCKLHDGRWVPSYPSQVYAFDQLDHVFPGEDGNRSWAYMIELGAHHMILAGILDPHGEDAKWMIDHMEDVQFLRSGMGWYPEERNKKDVMSFGGFAKVQPYYCRMTEIHGLRDDVKPFVRSYLNAIPSLLNAEVLSFWEHFHNIAAWHKPHETGWFLSQTRMMLLMERGSDLWLAPFVCQAWFRDGLGVAVRRAPTRFGPVSYAIRSHVDEGYMEASIRPPARSLPDRIVLRLRHPMGKLMKEVSVNGEAHQDFDPISETIALQPYLGEIRVRANYARPIV